VTSWIKYEREHGTDYRSFRAFVMSRHTEPGSVSELVIEQLRAADLPPAVVSWAIIEQWLVDAGWNAVSVGYAHRVHDRYISKGCRRYKWRRDRELEGERA
jgi:hypothetical protein